MTCISKSLYPSMLFAAVLFVATTPPASVAQNASKESGPAACFARLKKLAGDWVQKDPKTGKEEVKLRYRVISGGSAVEETMVPGQPYEMTSIYHMNNGVLEMTHYCSAGNQPHFKATSASTPEKIEFECTGNGSNMKSENDMHIHHVLFVIPADDHFTSEWSGNSGGKTAGPPLKIEVRRKSK